MGDHNQQSKMQKNWNLLTERYRFKGNEPLLLDDPQTVWLVKSGSLALFAVETKHGIPQGSRRYLFGISAGMAMFAIESTQNERHQILAVSIEDTELVKVSIHDLNSVFARTNDQDTIVGLIENWIMQLSATLADLTPPIIPQSLQGRQFFPLIQGQIFQPRQGSITWVQIQQGCAKWMGLEEQRLMPSSGILPLSANLWLQADDTVELTATPTSEISNLHTLLNGVAQLQMQVLNSLGQLDRQEKHAEFLRFQERGRLNHQVMQEALGELASVLERQNTVFVAESPPSTPDEALLAAAGAVGRALGITLCPPAQSDDPRRMRNPIDAIAHASRIRMRQITLQDQWWNQDGDPMLAYRREDGCPIALLPGATGYELFNPLEQTRVPVNSHQAATIAPTAYTFYRPLPAQPLNTLTLLRFALRGHWQELRVVLLTGVAVTLLGMLTPQATAILIDTAIPDANRGVLLQIALGLAAAAFGGLLFQLAQGLAITRLETFADAATQAAVWDRLLNLKAAFFRSYSIGDLNSRVTAISQIRQRLSGTLLKSIFSSLFSLLNLGLLFYYSAKLALIACIVAIVNIAVTVLSGILTLRKVRPLLEQEGQIFGVMVQLINGVAKLRVAGAETRAFAYWGRQYTHQLRLTLSTQGIEDSLAVIHVILPAITTAALFWFATGLLQQAQTQGSPLSTGTFLAFNTAFGTFLSGATSLSSTAIMVLQVLPLWKRAEPILTAEPEISSSKTDPGRLSGRLQIDHAVFRYREDGALTLDDVSLQAEPGEFIAIVGPSGSGKSTLFRLLLGFEVPESGSIYYDGQDLAGLDIHAVRRQLGVVMQNSRLTSASIFENIASGALISMDEAWQAAHMAGLSGDVEAMPMGMHTVVSEGGSNLSGGQRQRLLITRALVLKPRILLFDEATSALDNQTQAIVSQSLEQLQVTRVVIAHRLSTIRNADRIYVLQNGRVVQQGRFEQLANQAGLFAQLMARQML